MSEVAFGRTRSRSLLGTMTDYAFMAQHGHARRPEPEGGRLAGSPSADETVQAVGDFKMCARQKPAGDTKPDDDVVG